MEKVLKKFKPWWVDLFICGLFALIGLLVGRANYLVGTSFLGWDTVWSEVNVKLAIQRAVSGVWQEFQGLGLQGGHGYVSDIVHSLWVWLIAVFVQLSQVRYVSIFLLWIVGAWGAYFLTKRLVGIWGAIVAGSVYLLHPFILQQFFVIHDSFAWFFAFLPWSILAIIALLDKWNAKNLIWALLTQFVLSFAGFIPPQMVAYGIVVGILLLAYGLVNGWVGLKRIVIVGLLLLVAHTYWLLPFGRYALTNTDAYLNSKLNQVTTPENGLKSDYYGGWDSLIFGKGFYFESLDIIDGDVMHSEPILSEWEKYWGQDRARNVLIVVFSFGVLGLISLLIEPKWWKWGMAGGWVLAGAGLAISAWPISYVGKLFHLIPIFEQAFRIGFTKFSILYVFLLAIFVAMGIDLVGKIFKNWGKFVVAVLLIGGMLYVAWPVFLGDFVYKRMRVDLPREYSSLVDYMKGQPKDLRIASLPVQTFNGWMITDWGYTGSGFLFYGVEQPILDRAFDVWSPYNEGFYQEFSTAMYGGDGERVASVLDKYDVRYVLLDESIIAPGQSPEILRIEEAKQMAREMGWEEVWREGFLTVWETPYGRGDKFVSAPSSYTLASGDTTKTRRDVIYEELGDYVSGLRGIVYPFADLMREEVQNVKYGDENITLSSNHSLIQGSKLLVPGFDEGEKVKVSYELALHDGMVELRWAPTYSINSQAGPKLTDQAYDTEETKVWVKVGSGKENAIYLGEGETKRGNVELTVGEVVGVRIYEGDTDKQDELAQFTPDLVQECWRKEGAETEAWGEVVNGAMRLWIKNAAACLPIKLAKTQEDELVQVLVNYESANGMEVEFCLDKEGGSYECENDRVWGIAEASKSDGWVMRTVMASEGDRYWLDLSAKQFEPLGELRSIVYQVPIVNRYLLIKEEEMVAAWGEYLNDLAFEIEGDEIKVEVKGEPVVYDFAQFGRKEAFNCDVLGRGQVEKSKRVYSADGYGASCDFVGFVKSTALQGYLMRVVGENKAGRSLKIFLYNAGSGRNDLEYLLDEGKFDQTFSLLPFEFLGEYSLNIDTRSFGDYTENRLEPVEVRYFPLEQIAGAKVGVTKKVENNLQIKDVKKAGTWLYRVKTDGSGLLKLSQGYEEGWVGVESFDFTQNLRHVKVDGWANGWVVPEGEGEIVIFYWPQMLEYLGFGLLIGTFIMVFRKTRRRA
ncbi:MAG: hypothetical protein UY18_C0003G0002 [Microgenomates group bacterium GW2011_GWF2_47_9]|nr:MAG: hypothetical protein UY18_C0003G0002 [Microgenomates group bacterium GW2011_GWF2_47_9]